MKKKIKHKVIIAVTITTFVFVFAVNEILYWHAEIVVGQYIENGALISVTQYDWV